MMPLRNALASILIALAAESAQAAPPSVTAIFPAGGRRGDTVKVNVSGKFDQWPPRIWTDEPGVTFEPSSTKGELVARIATDAVPGARLLRLYGEEGPAAPRAFLVGTLPELAEKEPNDEPTKCQEIDSLPILINGRLSKRGDVDAFQVLLAKGQTLVAAVAAQRELGSPMDAVLQVVSADGFVLQQDDDSPATDPLTTFTAPTEGRYVVRIFAFPATPNSTIAFAGGEGYVYRLTLTTAGAIERAFPLAIEAGAPRDVEFLGWNLPPDLRHTRIEAPAGSERIVAWHPRLGGHAMLSVVDHPSLIETRSCSTPGPRRLPVPSCISGRIEGDGAEDRYGVALKKGQVLRATVQAQRHRSPLDPVISILDDKKANLMEQDDSSGRDPELTWTVPRDGDFLIAVRDLYGRGGERFVYLLDLEHPRPDFALEAKEETISLAPGKSARLNVAVVRKDGFASPIVLECPTLPPGIVARPSTSEPKGPSASVVSLTLEASTGTKPFAGPLQVVGRSGDLKHSAQVKVPSLPGTNLSPWLTVSTAGKP